MDDLESVFRVLASRRRRLALGCLTEHATVALADLAEWVAEREAEEEIIDVPPEEVREVYLSLYHTHVPKLEDAGLVHYGQESDLVRRTEEAVPLLTEAGEEVDSLIPQPPSEPR